MTERTHRMTRSFRTSLETREEGDSKDMIIQGYFAVFGQQTELFPGGFEEVAPSAFDETLGEDVRALTNHETTLVLGRNKAGTLELKVDSRGLWGSIRINPKDTDAVNIYERVARGDVDQCSFGFEILDEATEFRDDGSIKWTLRKVRLHEVSVCTFPAYTATGVQARKAEAEQLKSRRSQQRKNELKARLKKNGD